MTMDAIEGVLIPESELVFKASRSSGPGGQNVNKLNTRVTVLFDVAGSPSLSEEQKQQILQPTLHVAWTRTAFCTSPPRSIAARRRTAGRRSERLQQLVQEALKPVPVRKKTKTPAAARERRLQEKKQRSDRKQQRMGRDWSEG